MIFLGKFANLARDTPTEELFYRSFPRRSSEYLWVSIVHLAHDLKYTLTLGNAETLGAGLAPLPLVYM